ncbi:hypothetical protein BGZ99_008622 [Dissophora globulifera]|uniref:Uncharacterized protein n=1 Tax=Dissophora globulifera TaxID=979702 RepID=A0A9P6RTS2_9FUNG|nr:hypothetical protein BGZ99_008622 [Dissophora globulifera]
MDRLPVRQPHKNSRLKQHTEYQPQLAHLGAVSKQGRSSPSASTSKPALSAPKPIQFSGKGKSTSILETAINAFPEFRAQNEEFLRIAASSQFKAHASKGDISEATALVNYTNSTVQPNASPTANATAESHLDKHEEGEMPAFNRSRKRPKLASEMADSPPSSPVLSPVVSCHSDTSSTIPSCPATSIAIDKTRDNPDVSNMARSEHSSERESSKGRKPNGSFTPDATGNTQGSSPLITSSAAFEKHVFDIQQYVSQDLQGYNRLSY